MVVRVASPNTALQGTLRDKAAQRTCAWNTRASRSLQAVITLDQSNQSLFSSSLPTAYSLYVNA